MAQHIKTILHTIITQHNSTQWHLLRNWHTIFGNLSNHVILEKVYRETIVLGIYDSCLMHELYQFSSLLLEKINENLDQPCIKQLRFIKKGRKKGKKMSLALKKTDGCTLQKSLQTFKTGYLQEEE